jgi:3-deoxy-D-manno-octulosonate 8-phosphate phosphatase (KDO 8-P phosphatase)
LSAFESNIESVFTALGAKFAIPASKIKAKQENLKAFIFDWDGVFNDGVKRNNTGSPFSEVDSMGLNMLRFSFYLKCGFIPAIFIVTGENNKPALQLSKREHLNGVYLKTRDKKKALSHIEENFSYTREEIAFIFDDILDLGVAENVSLRYFINRDANPLLNDFISRNKIADYYTANIGANNAVREVCELSIGMNGNFDEVVRQRIDFSSIYQKYLSERNDQPTQYFTFENDRITDFQNH